MSGRRSVQAMARQQVSWELALDAFEDKRQEGQAEESARRIAGLQALGTQVATELRPFGFTFAASANASASRSPLARSSSARPVAGPSHRSLVSPVKTAPGRIAGGQTGYSTTARGDPLRCSAVGCDQKLPARQGGCDWCPVHCPGESCQSAAHQRHRSEPDQPRNVAGQQQQLQQQRWAAIGGNSPHVHVSKRVHAQPNPAYQPRLSATPTTAQPTMQPTTMTATQAAQQPTAQPTMQAAMRAVMQLGMQPGVQNSTSVAQRLAQVCLLQLLAQQQQQQGPR